MTIPGTDFLMPEVAALLAPVPPQAPDSSGPPGQPAAGAHPGPDDQHPARRDACPDQSAGPPACRPLRRVFPGDPGQVAHARRFVRRALAGDRPAGHCPAHDGLADDGLADDGLADDAALLVSELAANAIAHTATGDGGSFEIIVCQRPGTVCVLVTDGGSPGVPTLAPAGDLDASGRGLAIVAALARRWGHQAGRGGRIVWFELDSPVPAASAARPGP
jgi:Histidine kinase-like ATPase domain